MVNPPFIKYVIFSLFPLISTWVTRGSIPQCRITPTMYHILYKPPYNVALIRADARTDIRMDGQRENSIPADKHSLRGYNNTLDLIITSLPDQRVDIHSSDRLSDQGIVSRTLKVVILPLTKLKRKLHRYKKGDYESTRNDALKFAKEKYFNGYSDTCSVQENFNFITSFIQNSAYNYIPSKTSRSVSSVPWITPEIRRKCNS